MNVVLRPLSVDDLDAVMTWVNDKEVVGNLAVFAGAPITREQERAWIERVTASPEDRVFSIFAAEDGRYLGQVGLHQIFRRSGLSHSMPNAHAHVRKSPAAAR